MRLLARLFAALATFYTIVAFVLIGQFMLSLNPAEPPRVMLVVSALGSAMIGGICDGAARRLSRWGDRTWR